MTNVKGLAALAQGQHGAFLAGQAHQAGVPADVLRGWISSGLLTRFGVRTLRSSFDDFTPQDHAAALLLDIKPVAWIDADSAATLHSFDGFADRDAFAPPFHVLLPRGSYVRRPGLRVHTTLDMPLDDRVFIEGLPVTNPTRTLINLARRHSPQRLTAALDGALRDRLLTEDLLITRIAQLRSQGRYGIPKLLDVIEGAEVTRGGHSWLERKYLEIAAAAGLPRPEVQRVMGRTVKRLIRVDCYYPDADLVVELLGYRWHRSRAQLNRDTERNNELIRKGHAVLQFTYDHLVLTPEVVVQSVLGTRAARLRQTLVLPTPGQGLSPFT
ncbi:MAG TPA: hypothetical protein DCR14_12320 [Acidimicrobiaceae bacterium]|nr:hypothetical protein [Acidimicrobiaceae bacterium]